MSLPGADIPGERREPAATDETEGISQLKNNNRFGRVNQGADNPNQFVFDARNYGGPAGRGQIDTVTPMASGTFVSQSASETGVDVATVKRTFDVTQTGFMTPAMSGWISSPTTTDTFEVVWDADYDTTPFGEFGHMTVYKENGTQTFIASSFPTTMTTEVTTNASYFWGLSFTNFNPTMEYYNGTTTTTIDVGPYYASAPTFELAMSAQNYSELQGGWWTFASHIAPRTFNFTTTPYYLST